MRGWAIGQDMPQGHEGILAIAILYRAWAGRRSPRRSAGRFRPRGTANEFPAREPNREKLAALAAALALGALAGRVWAPRAENRELEAWLARA
jgi:hypothetical protein